MEQHKNGGGIGVKHSPGVVTATDSLESEFGFLFVVSDLVFINEV